MTTPDDAGTPAPDDTPRYGQRAPQPPAGSTPPAGPTPPAGGAPGGYGQPTPNAWGQPQYGQYGAPQYGTSQYGGGAQQSGYGPPSFAGKPYAPPANKPGIIPLRPLTLGEIFDGAFGAIRANPKVMLGMSATVIAVATVVGLALGVLVSGIFSPQIAQLEAELGAEAVGLTDMFPLFGATLVSSLVLGLAMPVVNGILITSVGQSVIGRKASAREVWDQARSKVWALLGFSILWSLAVGAVWFVYLLLTVLAFTASVGLGVAVALLGLLGVGVFFAWFVVRTLLVPPAMVLEGQGFASGVKRGWTVSRGSFWRLLGIYLLAYLAVWAITSIVAQPFGLVGGMVSVMSMFAMYAIIAVGSVFTGVISAVFLAGVVSLLYIDVRMRREGLDVELTAAANERDEHGTA
ncbi:hypothetical protein H9623_10385 [Oerskovia sp. Sa1BUA8]|uniref:DUF7847 domain-containing protein n=1 Tax=Oerskovia douganii TaxID=2762210 RepID=A0A9D5UHK2_9CELL|nr:hypothetical protein [Oerskovia douganii]MBE7700707.1 hypothetical protein [Oerskovia douganii]